MNNNSGKKVLESTNVNYDSFKKIEQPFITNAASIPINSNSNIPKITLGSKAEHQSYPAYVTPGSFQSGVHFASSSIPSNIPPTAYQPLPALYTNPSSYNPSYKPSFQFQ